MEGPAPPEGSKNSQQKYFQKTLFRRTFVTLSQNYHHRDSLLQFEENFNKPLRTYQNLRILNTNRHQFEFQKISTLHSLIQPYNLLLDYDMNLPHILLLNNLLKTQTTTVALKNLKAMKKKTTTPIKIKLFSQ